LIIKAASLLRLKMDEGTSYWLDLDAIDRLAFLNTLPNLKVPVPAFWAYAI